MTLWELAHTPFGYAVAAVAGLVVGSFLNVVIHRLPKGESVVSPPSRCPSCGARVRPLDNVPVFSWVLLGGKCRSCRAPISIRYPIVEIANGLLWTLVLAAAPAGSWGDVATGAFLASACIALTAIDLDEWILPDWITLPGTAVGLALSFFSVRRTPLQELAGAALGAGGLFLLRFVYERITRREGMGLGDVKMLGMMGALLGPLGALVGTFVAAVTGSVVGLALIGLRGGDGKTQIKFGPFLAFGAVFAWFFAAPLTAWYRSLLPR